MTRQEYEEFQELARGLLTYVISKSSQRKPIDLWYALQTYEVEDKAQICVLSLIAVVNAAHQCASFHEYLPLTPFRWMHYESILDSETEERALALLDELSELIENQVELVQEGSPIDNDLVIFMRRAYRQEQAARSIT